VESISTSISCGIGGGKGGTVSVPAPMEPERPFGCTNQRLTEQQGRTHTYGERERERGEREKEREMDLFVLSPDFDGWIA